LDLQSYAQCRAVSKFWRSISTSQHLERILLDSETRKIRTNFETLLQEKYSHDNLDFENFWADYPPHDSTNERLLDIICAAKLNKTLLDIAPGALSDLLRVKNMSIIDVRFQPYLIKVRASTVFESEWTFKTTSNKGSYEFVFSPHKTLPWIFSQHNNGKAYVVVRLLEFLMRQRFTGMQLVFFRILDPLKWTLGIFSNSVDHLRYLAVAMIMPQVMCVTMKFPDKVLGLLLFLAMTFNKIGASTDPANETQGAPRFFSPRLMLILWTLMSIIGTVLLYPYSLNFYAYIVWLYLAAEYQQSITSWRNNIAMAKWRKHVATVIFAVIYLTSFDWSAVIFHLTHGDKVFRTIIISALHQFFARIYLTIDQGLLHSVRSASNQFAKFQPLELNFYLAVVSLGLYQI
jgi:hypothetical protein